MINGLLIIFVKNLN